jgi:hypothetical protein
METRKKIKGKYSRKLSTQEKTVPHPMRMMTVIVTQKEYSLWYWKMIKKIMNNKMK